MSTSTDDLRLIDVRELGRITGLSAATIWRHHEAGLIPPGHHIGRAVRWRLRDITAWIDAGCPRCDSGGAGMEGGA
jgi:predicted DNA-binding transcriptional regulator AlpA